MNIGQYRPQNQQTVVYGKPLAEALPEIARDLAATKVAVVTSNSLSKAGGLAEQVKTALGNTYAGTFSGVHAHTPRADVIALTKFLRESGADAVVSIGGGSVCDATKLARVLLSNGVSELEDMDRLRAPAAIKGPEMKYICIPTTLSAGEYTPYAGSTDERGPLKEAYYHPALASEYVILDPAVSADTPDDLWFSTGIRAIDHAVEGWCAAGTTPMADATALHALRLLYEGLSKSIENPRDMESRLDSQIGAWLAIQSFVGGTNLGGSHAIGHALGGTAGMSHGHTSCVLLPHILRYNLSVNADRQKPLAAAIGQPDRPTADLVEELVKKLGLPGRLRDAGIPRDLLPKVADAAMHDPWINTNPRQIDGPKAVLKILEEAY